LYRDGATTKEGQGEGSRVTKAQRLTCRRQKDLRNGRKGKHRRKSWAGVLNGRQGKSNSTKNKEEEPPQLSRWGKRLAKLVNIGGLNHAGRVPPFSIGTEGN